MESVSFSQDFILSPFQNQLPVVFCRSIIANMWLWIWQRHTRIMMQLEMFSTLAQPLWTRERQNTCSLRSLLQCQVGHSGDIMKHRLQGWLLWRVLTFVDDTRLNLTLSFLHDSDDMNSFFFFRRKEVLLCFLLEEVNPLAILTTFSLACSSLIH